MPAFPHTVIRASAGTGKTFQLSNRFLALAAVGQSSDHILATTFARKAAGEILDRVLTRLADAVDDPRRLADLAKHLGIPEFDRAACLSLLQSLIKRVHRLRVGTLDSFFAQLAGSFGLELGLPPAWRIAEEHVDRALRYRAIQEVLRTEETNAVVELMHLLGKGELKRSITDQMFDTVNSLLPLFQETPREAWHGLGHRAVLSEEELDQAIDSLEQSEAFGANKRFLTARAEDVNRARDGQWKEFLEKGLAGKISSDEETFYKTPIGPEIVAAYQPVLSHARGILINQTIHQTEASWRLLDRFHTVYRELKSDRRSLRFEDVTFALVRGLAELPQRDVAFRLDSGTAHLLLDEFQDTSLGQWSVMERFAIEATRPGRERSFFCVGDVKQAIYGWRGGVSAVFDAVTERLSGLTTLPLNQSFRSSQPIIDTVNLVFGKLGEAPPMDRFPAVVEAWSERFQPHTTARNDLDGYCRLVVAPAAAAQGTQFQTTLEYAATLIADVARRTPDGSVGVLVRTNEAVARLVYLLRERHHVAASEEGGNPLTDSTGVQVVLSAMALADHPGDSAARFHLSHSPLGPIVGVAGWNDDVGALRASRQLREALQRDGYGPTVYRWVRALAPSFDERELKRMLQLVELAYRFDEQATVRADDFVAFVRATRVEDPSSAPVRVMTVHQAKGLQFDVVVLPELDKQVGGQMPNVVAGRDEPHGPVLRVCRYAATDVQKLLPEDYRRAFEESAAERANESLCVLYVALTRAIHEMHLVISPSKENEKTIPATFAGLLRATLAGVGRAEPGATLFETGNVTWRDAAPRAANVEEGLLDDAEPSTSARGEVVTVRLAASPATRTRGLERQSPSGKEGGGWVGLSRLLRPEASAAMSRGTLIHKWFEQIEWLDDGEPNEAVLRQAALGLVTPELDLEADLKWFRSMLGKPAIRAALSRGAYQSGGAPREGSGRESPGGSSKKRVKPRGGRDVTKGPSLFSDMPDEEASSKVLVDSRVAWPDDLLRRLANGDATLAVERERPFALRDENTLLQGTMDRVVWCRDADGRTLAADILDFKTDALDERNPESLAKAIELYAPQMAAYRDAVARLNELDPARVTGRLLFVGSGLVAPM